MPNDGDLADMLLDWIPDEVQRNKILAANPARLYDFWSFRKRYRNTHV